jgi:uncharacterized protein (DUF2336 family)
MRRAISEAVANALVETGDEGVIKTLLENDDTQISKATVDYLLAQSQKVDSHDNPRLAPGDIDPEITKRAYRWASAAIRKHVLEVMDIEIDPTDLDIAIEDSVEEILADGLDSGTYTSKEAELARRLAESEQITSKLTVNALQQGEVALFQALFAQQTGLRSRLVKRILFEIGGEALVVACKAIDMPKDDFATLFRLTRKARRGKQIIPATELTRMLNLYDRVTTEAAQSVLGRWQRDSEYLNAVRILSGSGSPGTEAKQRKPRKRAKTPKGS